jgi:hypothetical protein
LTAALGPPWGAHSQESRSGGAIRKIFTPEVITEISNLVARGFSAAEPIGCTLSSLRVTCSRHGISLRRSKSAAERRLQGRLAVELFGDTAALLQREAEKRGISSAKFAASLLETIVRDNLYDAVIDQDIGGVVDETERARADNKLAA